MKKILFISTVLALFIGVLSFIGCTPDHDELKEGEPSYLKYEFTAHDQVNVQQYEIEVSITGNVDKPEDWTTAGMLMANTGGLTHDYTMYVDVTNWFKKTNKLYSRIKTVDKDGKFAYNKVETTNYH